MIILLKKSACSGKYSINSSFVTQTKSSHFLKSNLFLAITWDLKKNLYRKISAKEFIINFHRKQKYWKGCGTTKERKCLEGISRRCQPSKSRPKYHNFLWIYLKRWGSWMVFIRLNNHMGHWSISNQKGIGEISYDWFQCRLSTLQDFNK